MRVIGPAVSWLAEIGTTWVREIRPTVGFSPTSPVSEAGQVTEPSVSVPIAAGASEAATATALPDDEPQAERSSAYGLRVRPPTPLQPLMEADERMLAHSERLVLPRMMAPASRSLATSGASRWVTLFASASEPAVVGIASAVSILSFTRIGTPSSGRGAAPEWRRLSLAAASASACGLTTITECREGPA